MTYNKKDYSAGHFPKALEELSAINEDKEHLTVSDVKQKYYSKKMKLTDNPVDFTSEVEELRNELRDEYEFGIEDPEFINDILSKLPKGEDGQLGLYQLIKRSILKDIEKLSKLEPVQHYEKKSLMKQLSLVYDELYPNHDNDDKDNGEVGLAAGFKQYKGRCTNCGRMGHQKSKCWQTHGNPGNPNGKTNNNNNNNNDGRSSKSNHNKTNNYNNNNNKGNGGKKYKFPGKCHGCGRRGHKKSQCWKLNGKPGDQGNAAIDGELAFVAEDIYCAPCGSVDGDIPEDFFDYFSYCGSEDNDSVASKWLYPEVLDDNLGQDEAALGDLEPGLAGANDPESEEDIALQEEVQDPKIDEVCALVVEAKSTSGSESSGYTSYYSCLEYPEDLEDGAPTLDVVIHKGLEPEGHVVCLP